jgi:hypothetical protein
MFNKGKEMWNKFKGDETWLEADWSAWFQAYAFR